MKRKKTLISICGPTAIGKTALSIKLAKEFKTEILSCDSRQFFKELKIGTAPPNEKELTEAKHHFIHNLSIHDIYSVGDFERDAIKKLNNLFKIHDIVIMVGGSGLYEKAVTEGLDEFPDVKPEIREHLNNQFKEEGINILQEQLKEFDPDFYTEIDIHNHKRLIRALEICIGTGKPYSYYRKNNFKDRNFNIIKIGLNIERDKLYDRINLRVDMMLKAGLLEEVHENHINKSLNSLNTVGYKEFFEYLENKTTLDKAIEEVKKNTRRFAKRQLTWFKKDKKIKWFTPLEYSNIVNYLYKQL